MGTLLVHARGGRKNVNRIARRQMDFVIINGPAWYDSDRVLCRRDEVFLNGYKLGEVFHYDLASGIAPRGQETVTEYGSERVSGYRLDWLLERNGYEK